MLGRIARMGAQIADRIDHLSTMKAFENPRSIGAIAAIDLRAPDAGYLSTLAPRLRAFFLDRGILLRPLGNTIYVMPPYCTDADQLDRIFAAIVEAGEAFA